MNFNLLKDIELPLKEQDEVLRRAPSEVVSERFMRMSDGHSKVSRVATATGV